MVERRQRAARSAWLGSLLLAWSFLGSAQTGPATPKKHTSPSTAHKASSTGHAAATTSKSKATKARGAAGSHGKSRHKGHRPLSAKALAKSRSLQRAFVASSQLRPMAQQLATFRTPAAYAGVNAYAQSHTGEAASAAYLAIGHAYLVDKKFPEAEASLA